MFESLESRRLLSVNTYTADFNYDGRVDVDDYALIDWNYTSVGWTRGNSQGGAVTAVGEDEHDFSGTAKNDRISVILDPAGGVSGFPTPLLVTINGKSHVSYWQYLRINANAGNDSIFIDLGEDRAYMHITIYGAAGDDTIIGGSESDRIFAGDGNDIVNAGAGRDSVYGETGDDSIRGGGSNDLLDGGDGADTLRGDTGNDNICGGANADRLRGSAGNDTLDGGGSRDLLAGEDGEDSLLGGAGEDLCDGGAGADYFNGGRDFDQLYLRRTQGDTCDLDELSSHEAVDLEVTLSGSIGGGSTELTITKNLPPITTHVP